MADWPPRHHPPPRPCRIHHPVGRRKKKAEILETDFMGTSLLKAHFAFL